MSRHGSQASYSCQIAIEFFHVAKVFCFSVVTMSRHSFSCRDRDGHDRDGHDKRSGVATELGQG